MLVGITEAILLPAIGIGYIVCYLAKREEGVLKTAGYALGIFIILLSLILLAGSFSLCANFSKMGKRGAGMKKPCYFMKGNITPAPSQLQK